VIKDSRCPEDCAFPDESPERYSPAQQAVIERFFRKLTASVNKTGRMADSKKARILESWELYPPDVVIRAMEVYLDMEDTASKGENYVFKIIRNMAAKELNNGRAGGDDQTRDGAARTVRPNHSASSANPSKRLAGIAGEYDAGETDCDF
jgi:hypothetical protein